MIGPRNVTALIYGALAALTVMLILLFATVGIIQAVCTSDTNCSQGCIDIAPVLTTCPLPPEGSRVICNTAAETCNTCYCHYVAVGKSCSCVPPPGP